MIPTEEERAQLITTWYTRVKQYEDIRVQLDEIFGCSPESKYHDAVDRLAQEYTYVVEQLIGDENQLLSWFFYDNDLGNGVTPIKLTGWEQVQYINTLEILIKVIEDCREVV